MGFFDAFSGNADPDEPAEDPLGDLTLDKLREGYLVDYDLKTWTVERHARYDYEGFPADEWTLRADGETLFLEYEDDDAPVFALSRTIDFADLDAAGDAGALLPRIEEQGVPPATLAFEGTPYELEESGPATRTVGGDRQELRYWVFEATEGTAAEEDRFVALERFGESDWSAYAGREVEPFEFDNILPRS